MDSGADALELAIGLAVRAHRGQRYPSPDAEPYIQHLLRVMLAVSGFAAQTTAVLHDVLEDTAITVEDLRNASFPKEVVDAVVTLTRRSGQDYDAYIEQVAENAIARQVKLADLSDNLANNNRLPKRPDVMARIERYERAIQRLRASESSSSTSA